MANKQFVLKNATVIDGLGNEPAPGMSIVIKDQRIFQILSQEEYHSQYKDSGIEEIDCTGKYIMPGLIDAHIHLWGGKTDKNLNEMGFMLEPMQVKAIRSVALAQDVLKYGFTSIRDISRNGLYLKRVFAEGSLKGPRVVSCGPGICKTGGGVDFHQLPPEFVKDKWVITADGPEEIRKAVRLLLREGADQLKLWLTGANGWPADRFSDQHYTYEEIEMACKEAKLVKGTRVAAHCTNKSSIRDALRAGVDSIEHGWTLDEELAALMAEQGVYLVPTMEMPLVYADEFRNKDASLDVRPPAFLQRTRYGEDAEVEPRSPINSFRLAREAGVKIAFGSDTLRAPLQNFGEFGIRELKQFVKQGMTPLEAIHAATDISSQVLGMSHVVGTIEEGKLADILIMHANPAQNIDVLMDKKNINCIIQEGEITVLDGIIQ